jgi:hypothetical protein
MGTTLGKSFDRRGFMGSAVAAAAFGGAAQAQSTIPRPTETRTGDMLYRSFGKTGETVSVLGVGGSHIGQIPDEDLAIRIVRTAVDRGVNFMDNSWDYNEGTGRDELRMGKALRDGYRQKVFLMTKVDGRTKDSAAKQLDESLKRLQTDHVDLLQFHESHPYGRSRSLLRSRWRPRSFPGCPQSRQDPLHRLHRPQRPRHPSPHARIGERKRLPF